MGLIKNQTVTVRWSVEYKSHFESLGYVFHDWKTPLTCNVCDLPDGSSAIVNVECDFCGDQYTMPYKQFTKHKSSMCCCQKCIKTKKKVKNKDGTVSFIDAPYRDKEWLYEQYITLNKSAKDIADEVGLNQRTLREWINKFNIQKLVEFEISYDDLYQLYVVEHKTTKEIGDIYNVCDGTILKKMNEYNIPRRSVSEYMHYWYIHKGGIEIMEKINMDMSRRIKTSCRQRNIPITAFNGFAKTHDALERGSARYERWRNQVFERDNYTCAKCGKRGGELQAHHIENFKYNIDLRYEVDNGITLCKECHAPGYEGSFHSIYGCINNNKIQFKEFMKNCTNIPKYIADLYE